MAQPTTGGPGATSSGVPGSGEARLGSYPKVGTARLRVKTVSGGIALVKAPEDRAVKIPPQTRIGHPPTA